VRRVKVKICGITNLEDALICSNYGAYALGFIFYEKSPRKIDLKEAYSILKEIPPFTLSVCVFVDPNLEEIEKVLSLCNFDILQLHGKESLELCEKIKHDFKKKIIKAIRIKDESSLKLIKEYEKVADYILLDTYKKGYLGGTGETFNWNIISEMKKNMILSGGLNISNIESAIEKLKPYAIDVSSGLEKFPGKKDKNKVKIFMEKVLSFKL